MLAPLNLALIFLFPSTELFIFLKKVRLKKKANKLWSRVHQMEQMVELVWTCSKVLLNHATCKPVYQKVLLGGNFWYNIDPRKICQYIFISRQCQLTILLIKEKKKKKEQDFVFIAINTKLSKKTTLKDNIRNYIPKQGECQLNKIYIYIYISICINQM